MKISVQILLYILLWPLHFVTASAQTQGLNNLDSLVSNDYATLAHKIKLSSKGSISQQAYLKAYLMKARAEKNDTEEFYAYKYYLHRTDHVQKIRFSDSMLMVAKRIQDSSLIASSYLTRGIVHYGAKDHTAALNSYLKATEYLTLDKTPYLYYKNQYLIAQVKYYLGYYMEALSLLNECLPYFKHHKERAYLNTLHQISLCQNRMGNYGDCSETNKVGLEASRRLGMATMEIYFKLSEGVNQYSRDNYHNALTLLNEVLPGIAKRDDFANSAIGYFYRGKSYLALGKKDKAMDDFKTVDENFNAHHYIRADLRESFEILLKQAISSDDTEQQLYYIDQLERLDSVLNQHNYYLYKKIFKEYDTKALERTKSNLEIQLRKEHKRTGYLTAGLGIVFSLLGLFVVRHLKIRKRYEEQFKKLMDEEPKESVVSPVAPLNYSDLNISEDVLSTVIKQLKTFEEKQQFLDENLSVSKLAAQLDVNSKYLSKIIARFRGKSFANYINDLKIDFIVARLKKEPILRKYTNAALAKEACFSTTQRFTRAFKSKTGISTSYFLEELKRGL
ncbi:helix-turn-helix domain-containing protein [Zhouia amylolytica]|nr:helix-turn-helix domain-containing protein [Zhouia amylolytica]